MAHLSGEASTSKVEQRQHEIRWWHGEAEIAEVDEDLRRVIDDLNRDPGSGIVGQTVLVCSRPLVGFVLASFLQV